MSFLLLRPLLQVPGSLSSSSVWFQPATRTFPYLWFITIESWARASVFLIMGGGGVSYSDLPGWAVRPGRWLDSIGNEYAYRSLTSVSVGACKEGDHDDPRGPPSLTSSPSPRGVF